MDGPVFVFFTGVSPSFSKRMRRSCGVELTLNCSPACAWISASSRRHSSLSSLPSSLRNVEVDANARVFHAREHAHERALDPLVELDQLARARATPRALRRARSSERGAALRVFDAGVAVEVERALDPIGRRELDREVAPGEILERVLPLARIEQVRHQRGVVLERPQVDVQAVRELLGPVRDEGGLGAARERLELLADLRRREQLGVDVGRRRRPVANASADEVAAARARPAHRASAATRGAVLAACNDGERGVGVARDDALDLERLDLGRGSAAAPRVAERVEDARAAACGTRAG